MATRDEGASADPGFMTLKPGASVAGRYHITEAVSASALYGADAVYRADDSQLGRAVMLRLLPPGLSLDDELAARLELRLTRNAGLPRGEIAGFADLIDVIDLGRGDRDQLFLVTEVYPAESLADLLARQGPLPWQRLRPLAVRACQIVHLSHEHGLIRQDLRTSSLYPIRDKNDPGILKVVSPGVLVATGDRVWSCADHDLALELARYAAPEQISTGVIDRRTDVYALGVILYECLTGRLPFPDRSPAHVLAAHLVTPPPPFPAAVRRRGVPAELEAIVARALAKDPDDRWPTVMALANAMAAIDLGRCDVSGVLETTDTNDLTELLEPQASATTMRVHRERLSGRPGLGPPPGDSPASEATAGEPTSSDATSSDATSSDATSSNATSSDATSSAPTSSAPTSSAPTSSAPTSSDPTSSDPTSSDPTSSDSRPTEEHVWADILDAAESTSGLGPVASASDASTSDSAITRISAPDDSAPTLPYGIAGESASRWLRTTMSTPAVAPVVAAPRRRVMPWLLAAGLSALTAGAVTYALSPARSTSAAMATRAPVAGTRVAAPAAIAPGSPGSGHHPQPAIDLTTPASVARPPASPEVPYEPLEAPSAEAAPTPDLQPHATGRGKSAAPAIDEGSTTAPAAAPRRVPARPRGPTAAPLPRKTAPGALLPDRSDQELPDPASSEPVGPGATSS